MDFAFGVVIYFVIWWITLFAILPLWVKPQIETGDVVPGTMTSAPVSAFMPKKIALTTLVAALIFLVSYLFISYEIITIDSIPFLPRFDGHYQ